MDRQSLNSILVIAVGTMVIGVAYMLLESQRGGQEVVYEYDDSSLRTEFAAKRSSGYVLRVALLKLGAQSEVVLDSAQVMLSKGEPFAVDLGFRTPPEQQAADQSSYLGGMNHFSSPDDWQSEIRNSRPVPKDYQNFALQLKLSGIYDGGLEGLHLVSFNEFSGHHEDWTPGSSSGGTLHLPMHQAAMRENVPIARVYLSRGLAFFAVVTHREGGVARSWGKRESWQTAFAAAATKEPLADREAIASAVSKLGPKLKGGSSTAANYLDYGPLCDLFAAGFALRDPDSIAYVRSQFEAQPELLREVLKAAAPDDTTYATSWYLKQVGGKWADFVSGWFGGAVDPEIIQSVPPLRVIELTKDVSLARQVVDATIGQRRYRNPTVTVLELHELGQTEGVRAEYRRLRSETIATLPFPWCFILQSDVRLLWYCLIVPLLVLLAVMLPVARFGRTFTTSRAMVFWLALFSSLTLCEFPLRVLLVPVWWVLCIRWLQEPINHGILGRVLVWLVLTLASVEALQYCNWYVNMPVIDHAVGFTWIFSWILVGYWVLHDGRWRKPHRFMICLWLLLMLNWLQFTITSPDGLWVVLALLGLGLSYLIGFLVAGLETASPADPMAREPSPA